MMTELVNHMEAVHSRSELVAFIRALVEQFNRPQIINWRNRRADEYLEALAAWLNECDGYYSFRGEPPLEAHMQWPQLAAMLLEATAYE